MTMHLPAYRRRIFWIVTATLLLCGLAASQWTLADPQAGASHGAAIDPEGEPETATSTTVVPRQKTMQVHYLEIVTPDVDGVCASYAAAGGVEFSIPDAGLGNARTAAMPGGGLICVRAPLRPDEEPIVRPYWLIDDIKAALAAAIEAGGQLAHPPMEIPGHGTFAIYIQGGVNHGLWQR